MPNWCENYLEVSGPKDDVQSFFERIQTGVEEDENGKKKVIFDLTDNLMPMPEVLRGTRSPVPTGEFDADGQFTELVEDETNEFWTPEKYEERKKEHYELVAQAEKAKAETGYSDWYHWANSMWGTKWGSCDMRWNGGENIDEETGIGTRFFEYETAWGPLQEDFWLSVSEMFPTLKFTIYYEEHGMCFHGIDSYHESDVVYSMSADLPQPSEDMSEEEQESFYDGERYYELIEAKTNEWYKQIEKVYQAV